MFVCVCETEREQETEAVHKVIKQRKRGKIRGQRSERGQQDWDLLSKKRDRQQAFEFVLRFVFEGLN